MHYLQFPGSNTLRYFVVLVRVFKFIGAKFRMVATVTGPCWIRHWMCTAIVSRVTTAFCNNFNSNAKIYGLRHSVTLYAEFLPTKQRAKCVVLLDVRYSLCYKIPSLKKPIYRVFIMFLVLLGPWGML